MFGNNKLPGNNDCGDFFIQQGQGGSVYIVRNGSGSNNTKRKQDLIDSLGHNNKLKSNDLFSQKNITEEAQVPGTQGAFISYLNYSDRSRSFVHGADMFPSVHEGLSHVLEQKGLSLKNIKKLRFKNTVEGDLLYLLYETPQDIDINETSVLGECCDDQDKVYYFYGKETNGYRHIGSCLNNLPEMVVKDVVVDNSEFYDKKSFRKAPLSMPFVPYTGDNEEEYISKMEENSGYVWATVLDAVNLMYTRSRRLSGLVISYENLVIDKQNFDPKKLFDGSCVLKSSVIGEPKPIRTNEFRDGYGYRCKFSVIDKNGQQIIKGGVTFFF